MDVCVPSLPCAVRRWLGEPVLIPTELKTNGMLRSACRLGNLTEPEHKNCRVSTTLWDLGGWVCVCLRVSVSVGVRVGWGVLARVSTRVCVYPALAPAHYN